jgi:uncharacterized membrane protein
MDTHRTRQELEEELKREEESTALLGRRAVNNAQGLVARYDPFLGPQVVVLLAIVLQLALPDKITIGPTWLIPALEAVLLVGLVVLATYPRLRKSNLRRRVALSLIAAVSASNIVSLVLLSHYLIGSKENNGKPLILSGVVLWVTNVLLFGLWYWMLDRGGPYERMTPGDIRYDFMFPQMTDPQWAAPNWKPGLVDYLYTSFTNATAFSPTDTMPLTAAAKWLMTAQSITALVTIGLVVARAVNILG